MLYRLVDIYKSAGAVEALEPKAMGRRAGTRGPSKERRGDHQTCNPLRFRGQRRGEEDVVKATNARRILGQPSARGGPTPRLASLKLTGNLRFQRVTVSSQNAHVQQNSSGLTPRRPATLGAKVAIDDRRMAERLAVVMDGGGVVGPIH